MLGNLDGHREVKGAVQPQWLAEICFMENRTALFKLLILFNFIALPALAQTPASGNINSLLSKISTYNTSMPVEKVFLQFDKPYYSAGDTVWFKGYLMSESLKYCSGTTS